MPKSKAIELLTRLDHEKRCEGSTMPPHYVPKTKYSDKTANGLTKCIVEYIRLTGGYADRINNMGVYQQQKTYDNGLTQVVTQKGGWRPGGNRKGIADIIATNKGKMVQIEVKIGKDRMSPHQKKIQAEVTAAGGVYMVARNFDDWLVEWLEL
jgi:hypothetical protein